MALSNESTHLIKWWIFFIVINQIANGDLINELEIGVLIFFST